MSTPSTVPMIAQDGSIGDIPAEQVNAALASGLKRGVNVITKDGQRGTIPIENLGQALQSGMMPEGSMVPRRPIDQPPSLLQQADSAITTLGSKIPGAIVGMIHALANPVQAGQQAAIQGMQSAENQPTTGSKVAATVAPLVGVDPNGVQQAAITAGKTGNYGPLVAQAALPLVAVRAGSAMAGKFGPQVDAGGIVNELASGEIAPKPALTDAAAAQKITDAVNPAPRQMAKFQANVEKQMPNIRQFVTDKPQSTSDLLNVVQQAAEAKRADYYQNIIQPNADVNIGAPSLYKGQLTQGGSGTAQVAATPSYPSKFAGGIDPNNPTISANVNTPRSTTIGMLDQRLSEINNQLSGAYDKEGVSQIQALSGQDKIALKAEAAQIRDLMNTELGARTGLGKDAVAQARSDFGQLRDIGMKLQQAISRQRYQQNVQDQAPVNPADVTATGLVRQAAKVATRKVIGTPQDRAIKSAF